VSPEAIITPANSRPLLQPRFLFSDNISFTRELLVETNGRRAESFRFRIGRNQGRAQILR
jgi:hypothetical protein